MIDVARTRALIDEIWNKRNLEAIDDIYAENFVGHDPQNPIEGRDGMREWIEEVIHISPDFHINLHETVAEGDVAVTRWTASGTHSSEWKGIPPTNRPYVVTGMTMSKFSDGLIVESWVNTDNLGMLQQLGIIPQVAT